MQCYIYQQINARVFICVCSGLDQAYKHVGMCGWTCPRLLSTHYRLILPWLDLYSGLGQTLKCKEKVFNRAPHLHTQTHALVITHHRSGLGGGT
eukprot:scaffold8606_cov21-Tisochrysis_lutea.AAC.5